MICADVSFVVPTYDRPAYLAQAIASICSQTVAPREIIVVDNGKSCDAVEEVLTPFADRVRIVRSTPGSVQIARNTGFQHAAATWVATLDDDDLLHTNYLEEALPLFREGVDIISTDHIKFRGTVFEERSNFAQAPSDYWNGFERGDDRTIVGKFPLAKLLQRIPIYPSTTIIRRDFALAIGGYDPAMRGIVAEDVEFLVRALTHGNLGIVWKPLVDYRLHLGADSASEIEQAIGRWRIFEHVRRTHPCLPLDFVVALDRDLSHRRVAIFQLAFLIGDRPLMSKIAPLLAPSDWTPKMRARKVIAAFPHSVRRRLRFGRSCIRR